MLICEGLTIKQLREAVELLDGKDTNKTRVDEAITRYLNSKPGTWRLISATTNQFGWYFIWSDGQ